MSAHDELLADIPLFALMDEEGRSALAGLLERRRIPAGTALFRAGDSADSLFIIRSGRVRCFVENTLGERIDLAELGPGEVLGEISLLDGGPRTASAETMEDVELLEMDRPALLEVIQRHPQVALDLMTVMGRRLRHSSELLRRRVTRNLNVEEQARLSLADRVAARVAAFGGSWGFIVSFVVVMVFWMTVNLAEIVKPFDPYPFDLLNFLLSTLAALLAPIILMSQNREAAKDRLKADLDYEINLKAELEVAHLHTKVDRLYETLQSRLAQIEHELTAIRNGRSAPAARNRGESPPPKGLPVPPEARAGLVETVSPPGP